MLTPAEVKDILDNDDDDDTIQGMGLSGFQPGSPQGKLHREIRVLKRKLNGALRREKALKEKLTAAGIAI